MSKCKRLSKKGTFVTQNHVLPYPLRIRFSLQNLRQAKEFIDQYPNDILANAVKEDLARYAQK